MKEIFKYTINRCLNGEECDDIESSESIEAVEAWTAIEGMKFVQDVLLDELIRGTHKQLFIRCLHPIVLVNIPTICEYYNDEIESMERRLSAVRKFNSKSSFNGNIENNSEKPKISKKS